MTYFVKYKIHIESLPHLQYFTHLSRGYWKQMLSLFEDYIKELPRPLPVAPSLLRDGKAYLKLQREKPDLCGFQIFQTSDELDIDKERFSDTKNIGKSKEPNIKTEVQRLEKVLLTTKKDQAAMNLKVLELSNENKNRLMDVLERNIYEFLENGNCLLTQLKPENVRIDTLIQTGKAIQKRRKRPMFYTRKCPNDVAEKLEKLKSDGLVGYGLEEDVFNIFVLERSRPESEKVVFKKKIEEIVNPLKLIPKIIWFTTMLKKYFAKPGSTLKSEENCGSVGVFGKTVDDELVFTTAGHLFTKFPDDAYVHRNEKIEIIYARDTSNHHNGHTPDSASPNPQSIKIGSTCANLRFSEKIQDFAVIKVDKEKVHMCLRSFPRKFGINEEFEKNPLVTLYNRSSANLKGELVHKVGSASGLTYGIVGFEDVHLEDHDNAGNGTYILIENSDHDNPFAEPGDSGAVVYRVDVIDGQPVAEVISTIMGEWQTKDKDGLIVCTLRMDGTLKTVEEEKNIKVHINHE